MDTGIRRALVGLLKLRGKRGQGRYLRLGLSSKGSALLMVIEDDEIRFAKTVAVIRDVCRQVHTWEAVGPSSVPWLERL